ncbi:MAG: permease [Pirellulaceae bacterium]|nr:permease [Pirellulaceae bacterium]
MVPGTAIGVLVGDLLFFWMALRLARRTGRDDVTSMPLGLDTPSTFGMVFFVLGPAFLHAQGQGLNDHAAAMHTWGIGICCIFISGVFKFGCALIADWVRRVTPRAGLLGSLAAIALVIISFLPLLEVLHHPIVGMVALAVVLTTLVARVPVPGRVPGALAALLVSGLVYYIMKYFNLLDGSLGDGGITAADARQALLPYEWLHVFSFQWLSSMGQAVQYLPIVIPFALATVVGGIDCTESAAAVGDEYSTKKVIGVEAFATLIAAVCGGVIQTTPYIGHPAYKAMGGRAAYTLATAIFVGSAGLFGYFGFMYLLIPKPTVFPILIFIGLEITAQSFHATPRRHYPAVALACIPALAYLALNFIDRIFGDPALLAAGLNTRTLQDAATVYDLQSVRVLANGFILTSLIWASALAAIIDRRLYVAAGYFAACAVGALFGIIHSPLAGSPMFLPWGESAPPAEMLELTFRYAVAYALMTALFAVWGWWLSANPHLDHGRGEPAEDAGEASE